MKATNERWDEEIDDLFIEKILEMTMTKPFIILEEGSVFIYTHHKAFY